MLSAATRQRGSSASRLRGSSLTFRVETKCRNNVQPKCTCQCFRWTWTATLCDETRMEDSVGRDSVTGGTSVRVVATN